MLWQLAYTEFVFLPINWPDFDKSHLEVALAEFQRRDRRYGASSG
jgi:undecaprenyl diphosphate synthase